MKNYYFQYKFLQLFFLLIKNLILLLMVVVLNCVRFSFVVVQTVAVLFLFVFVPSMFLWDLQILLLFLPPSQQHCLPILLIHSVNIVLLISLLSLKIKYCKKYIITDGIGSLITANFVEFQDVFSKLLSLIKIFVCVVIFGVIFCKIRKND